MEKNEVEARTIFLTTVGSHAYGMATATSDEDEAGVMVPPLNYYLSTQRFEQFQGFGKDKVIYDFIKVISLLIQNNPNILDLLYMDPKFYKVITPYWQTVVDNRKLFLSKKAKHTFSGYAFAQLKRIERHRKWFIDPPEKPSRTEYGLAEHEGIPQTTVNALASIPAEYFSDEYKEKIRQEKEYYFAKKNWDNYKEWEANRNKVRAETEKKFLLDTKHAAHLVRLISMAEEILTTGDVHINRAGIDADTLLAVRNGEWTYEKVLEWSAEKEKSLEEMYEKSTLPYSPDIKKIDILCKDVLLQFFRDRGEI
jgi:predicted nucleotidyltransferase